MATSSPERKQWWISGVSLLALAVAVGLSFFWVPVALALVVVGTLGLCVAFGISFRAKKAAEHSGHSAFPEHATFGGYRSPQTNVPM